MNGNQSFDENLMIAARALETEVAPDRDLWPEIENAITRGARKPGHAFFAQAAAVLLLIGASCGLTYLVMNTGTRTPLTAADNSALRYERASFGGQYILGPDYQDARINLRARLDEELDRLSPEVRAVVEKNIDTIRSAIDEIDRALAGEPDNAFLQELLLSTYRDELSLMMRVDGLANAVMSRTDI